jgi:copper homeostasis protein
MLLEVCVESPTDARVAASQGADRLELCAGLALDGLTPSLGLFLEVQALVSIPIVAMIRPRACDHKCTYEEMAIMLRDIAAFREYSPAGFVFGALTAEKTIDGRACEKLLSACGPVPAVFHRAFDEIADQPAALEELISLGFRRVLTSGGALTAIAGKERLRELIQQAAGRIEILPGCGVNSGNVRDLVALTRCSQVHGSFSTRSGHRVITNGHEVAAARAALRG